MQFGHTTCLCACFKYLNICMTTNYDEHYYMSVIGKAGMDIYKSSQIKLHYSKILWAMAVKIRCYNWWSPKQSWRISMTVFNNSRTWSLVKLMVKSLEHGSPTCGPWATYEAAHGHICKLYTYYTNFTII